MPSADTLLRGIKDLATGNETIVSSTGKQCQFNINLRMNWLKLRLSHFTKQLKKGKYYDFDYDNQIIAHEKFDAMPTYKKYEVESLPFTSFMEDSNFQLVISREKNTEEQADLFIGGHSILTNDHASTEMEVIEYYNGWGACEKTFDIQNNDFGWGHLPCSDMHHNTVYLVLPAMIKNFYNHFMAKVSKAFENIPANSQLEKIKFRFITVSGKWVKQSRQWKLRLYTGRPYEKLDAS